ncbi:MAG: DUF1028 domain-containing protein [Candidatus Polarisedimenticolia bacterium]
MRAMRGGVFAVAIALFLNPCVPWAAERAVPVPDPAGLHFATFSICAIDPATGESGVAVTTRVPFVGRAVPWARAGVGAVATQAWTVVEYGRQGLDLLEKKHEPDEVLRRLLADDRGRERRQIGLIDMQGRTAAFTGKETSAWAGSRQGRNYTVQGNILVGRQVIDAVADHFEASAGGGMPLAERLILALEAGQKTGGDRRWGYFQSAAIRIADPKDPGRGGDHLSLAIDVGEHPEPVGEMKRIYYATSRRLGYRGFSAVEGPDVVELKRLLQRAGYFRKDGPPIPAMPDLDFDRSLVRDDPERLRVLFEKFDAAAEAFMKAWAVFDAETVEAVDAFRKDHALDYEGNPRGLVDAALVEALRKAGSARAGKGGGA